MTVDPSLGNGGDEGIPEELPEAEADNTSSSNGRSTGLVASMSDNSNQRNNLVS